jgi:hypothetical protein
VYVETRIVQKAAEINKVMKKIRAVPAHEVDRTSVVSAEKFPEVGQDDFSIHNCILYGHGIQRTAGKFTQYKRAFLLWSG